MPLLDIAGSIVNGLMGIGLGAANNQQQLNQQGHLQNMQMQGTKDMTVFNQQQAYEMWKKTNYSAQVEQMKKAGLNPALLYGMGGGGGQTAQVTQGNVSGGQANAGAATMGIQSAAQLALLNAQRENIEADTANKRGDAANKPLVGKNLEASTTNTEAQTLLTNVNTRIAKLDEWIKGESAEDAISIIGNTADRLFTEVERNARENKIGAATVQTTIDDIKQQLVLKYLQADLMSAQTTTEKGKPALQAQEIKQSEAQIMNWAKLIVQRYREIEETAKGTDQRDREAQWKHQLAEDGIPMRILESVGQAIIFKSIINPTKELPAPNWQRGSNK